MPEASWELNQADSTGGEGFWVADKTGEPAGFVSYHDLASALGEGTPPIPKS